MKIASFFADKRSQILTIVLLFGLAYLLLLAFGAALRQVLRRAGDNSGLPDLVFGATLWITTVGTVTQLAAATAAFRAPALDPAIARALFDLVNIGFVFIGFAFTVYFAAAAASAIRTRAFPQWVNVVAIAAVVLNLLKPLTLFPRSGPLAPGGALSIAALVPIWIWTIAVGVLMIRRAKNGSGQAPAAELPSSHPDRTSQVDVSTYLLAPDRRPSAAKSIGR